MPEMHLLLLILGSVLLPKTYALRCNECVGATDKCQSTPKDCSSVGQCGTTRVLSYIGASQLADISMKSCAPPGQCDVKGSINFGLSRTLLASKCCSTDLCNTQTVPVSSDSSPNGKKCYGCDVNDCNSVLQCSGDEDRCISALVESGGQKRRMRGCASRSLCSGLSSAQMASVGQEMSCCEGDMCNSASSTGVSLLLLVAPPLYFAIFF